MADGDATLSVTVPRSGPLARWSASVRLLALVAVAVLPWTIGTATNYLSLYFAWGWLDFGPLSPTPITAYYLNTVGLPRYLQAYGIGAALFALALGSAALGLIDREDARVTAALLVVAGASELWFALGLSGQRGYLAIPVGTVLLWGVGWWLYAPAVKVLVVGAGRS